MKTVLNGKRTRCRYTQSIPLVTATHVVASTEVLHGKGERNAIYTDHSCQDKRSQIGLYSCSEIATFSLIAAAKIVYTNCSPRHSYIADTEGGFLVPQEIGLVGFCAKYWSSGAQHCPELSSFLSAH